MDNEREKIIMAMWKKICLQDLKSRIEAMRAFKTNKCNSDRVEDKKSSHGATITSHGVYKAKDEGKMSCQDELMLIK